VAKEFSRNLEKVKTEMRRSYDAAKKSVETLFGDWKDSESHPFVPQTTRLLTIQRDIERLLNVASVAVEERADDPLLDFVLDLFEGRTGLAKSHDWIANVMREGELRYAYEVPPGYADAKSKSGSERFGDLFVWKQLIDESKSKGRDVIFVSDECKGDWTASRRYPRGELVEEFRVETGQAFWLVSCKEFIKRTAPEGPTPLPTGRLTSKVRLAEIHRKDAELEYFLRALDALQRARDQIEVLLPIMRAIGQAVSAGGEEQDFRLLGTANVDLAPLQAAATELQTIVDSKKEPTERTLQALRHGLSWVRYACFRVDRDVRICRGGQRPPIGSTTVDLEASSYRLGMAYKIVEIEQVVHGDDLRPVELPTED
jgi:PIN like domain